jgi:hypothetical protein
MTYSQLGKAEDESTSWFASSQFSPSISLW